VQEELKRLAYMFVCIVCVCVQQEAICMYERVLADRTRSRDGRHHRAAGNGSDVISDERTLIGPGDCGPTPTRRYV